MLNTCLLLLILSVSADEGVSETIHGSFLVGGESFETYSPEDGDVIITSSDSKPIRKAFIRLTTFSPYTHAVVVFTGSDCQKKVLSADKLGGVELINLDEFLINCDGKIWIRLVEKPLAPLYSKWLREFAEAQKGKPYPKLRKLLGVPFRAPMVKKVTSELQIDAIFKEPEWFCSKIVVAACQVAGLLGPEVRARWASPADLYKIKGPWKKPPRWAPQVEVWRPAPKPEPTKTPAISLDRGVFVLKSSVYQVGSIRFICQIRNPHCYAIA